MRYVRGGRAKSFQDTNEQLIKVNRDIHESKGVNVVFDILPIGYNGLITLLRVGKILAMDHDLSSRRRGICLLESSPRKLRSSRGRDKLH